MTEKQYCWGCGKEDEKCECKPIIIKEIKKMVKDMHKIDAEKFVKEPYCYFCKKPMTKIDGYTYETNCRCNKKKLRLSIG